MIRSMAPGLLLTVLLLTPARAADSRPVQVWLGNQPVYTSEVAEELDRLAPETRQRLTDNAEAMGQFMDNLIARRLFLLDAAAQRIDKSDTFIREMTFARNELLLRNYTDRLTAGIAMPTEFELKAFYDANPAEFKIPKAVECEFIVVSGETVAKSILQKLKKGGNFAKLREANSLNRDTVVLLTEPLLAQDPNLRMLVADLKPRQLAASPYTKDGATYFILRKVRDVPESIVPYQRIREAIGQKLYEDRVNAVLQERVEQLKKTWPVK